MGIRRRKRELRRRGGGCHRPAAHDGDRVRGDLRQRLVRRAGASAGRFGIADNDYAKFLDRLDAQKKFIDRLQIDADLRAYVFYPRGWLLRRDPTEPMPADDTLVIEEEEVPCIGASLKRTFQYARSSNGKAWLWVGRSKTAGRGEAASALRFDIAVKKATLR